MKPPKATPPATRTWRDLTQTVSPRAITPAGRKRSHLAALRFTGGLVILAACLYAAFEFYRVWQANPAHVAATAETHPLRSIQLRTDGVLSTDWIHQTLALPTEAGLMDLDLSSLRARLLAHGQIRTAVLTRRFPDTLEITLEERVPIIRILLRDSPSSPSRLHLVDRRGHVYPGHGYASDLITSLPWLGGVRLVRAGHGYAPVSGMEAIAQLLTTALANTPSFHRAIEVISLERFPSDALLLVRTPAVEEITFNSRDDFYRQLAQLDFILAELRPDPSAPPLASINLAVSGRQIPVALNAPSPSSPPSRQPITVPSFRREF